jgi:hypothetical protein
MWCLKGVGRKCDRVFYPGDSSIASQAPQMLDSLPTRSGEIILTNMMQSASLTLRIMKSLYRWADLNAPGEAATYSDDESLKLIEDSAVTAEHFVDMLPVDMSLW